MKYENSGQAGGCGKSAAALLKELIRIRSMSGEENELAEFVAGKLENMGMKVYRDRHGNLYGEYSFGDAEGPVILLNTHLDNVPVGDGWERGPFAAEEEDGVIWGRGACDPKGAMAAMLTAVDTVVTQRPPEGGRRQGKLIFMGAVAEEISPPSAKGTWKAVKDGLVKADMAICGEPTDNIPCIGEFGKMEYEIITHGKPSHGSAPEKGINAVIHMAHLLIALEEQAERRWSDLLGRKGTLNVGTISGGVQINIVPETARAQVERRLVPGQTAEGSLAELRRICDGVKEKIPELNYEINVAGEGNAAVISREEPAARLMRESVEAVTGRTPADRGFVAHADADWLITCGNIPTVIYGPGALSDAHTSHEKVRAADVEEAALVLTEFLDRALRPAAGDLMKS
ncbi:M20 family metallopeptidase [Bacilliculturomica massiliensis]|uniref:M20 family metallopeptidase n=1 Tax=Bacilliculturomica massiliensis TaxID=1917867 RepID=UPI0013EF3FFC|nr:ArgE/DapE family deacylase [Bacilliculturomica massiliensis]